MSQFKPFIPGHEELIHDLNYDFYGKRIATCSSDQTIKVFDKVERPPTAGYLNGSADDDGKTSAALAAAQQEAQEPDWVLSDSWKAHDSTIVKVVWAGPEFGQVIASCSYDATIKIFEEDPREPLGSGRRWKKCATIMDFHGAVYDLAFAPSHMGLKLASIDSEGYFHIHEAPDPNNLQFWTAVMPEESLVTKQASKNRQSAFSLSWCPSMFFKEYIAVSAQDSAYIYHRSPSGGGMGKFRRVAELSDCTSLIRSISWAPSMGRGFQLIATGSIDGKIRIYKVTKSINPESSSRNDLQGQRHQSQQTHSFDSMDTADIHDGMDVDGADGNGSLSINVEPPSSFQGHDSGEVWRVSWNVTGTILASAGSDGNIKFWKLAYKNEFQCMAVVSAEQRGGIGGAGDSGGDASFGNEDDGMIDEKR